MQGNEKINSRQFCMTLVFLRIFTGKKHKTHFAELFELNEAN